MLDAGQFLISKKQLSRPDYVNIILSDGYVLQYHRKLRAYVHEKGEIILLGTAWQVREDRQEPVKELERLAEAYPNEIPEEAVLSMEESWCGRYLLIVQGNVYLDAVGLLGVFYSREGISGSIRLLAEVMELPERIYQPAELNWLPGPLTQYDQIRRLLPSQIYHFRTGAVHGRQLLASWIPECGGDEERIRKFTECFSNSLKNMTHAVSGRKILIALTGGYDSRTLLSLAAHAGIPFECFTLGYDRIPAGDKELPARLCHILDRGYTYVNRDPDMYSEHRKKEYALHTGGLADDGDKIFYSYGQYQELTKKFGDVVVLRSSIWETAVEYYMKMMGDELEPQRIYDYLALPKGGIAENSLKEYFSWAGQNRQDGISAVDRFYWEQRAGSWMSSIEQSFDMMEGILSLQPANSRFLITLLLSFPRDERIIRLHQRKIISFACPELLEMGFGDSMALGKNLFGSYGAKVKKGLKRLQMLGLKKTVSLYTGVLHAKAVKKKLERENDRK